MHSVSNKAYAVDFFLELLQPSGNYCKYNTAAVVILDLEKFAFLTNRVDTSWGQVHALDIL